MFLLLVFLSGLTLLSFFFLDEPTVNHIYKEQLTWYNSPWVNGFVQLGKGWVVVWLLLLWVWRKSLSGPIISAFIALLLLLPIVLPLKKLVSRTRPYIAVKAQNADPESDSHNTSDRRVRLSFPSGDTATVFAVAGTLMIYLSPGWNCLLLLICSGVGALRVLSLKHYPSDVFAGAAIGLACGWLANKVTSRNFQQPLEAAQVRKFRRIAGVGLLVLVPLNSLFEDHNSLLSLLKVYGVFILLALVAIELYRRGLSLSRS